MRSASSPWARRQSARPGFEAQRAFFRQPHGAAARVLVAGGDLDQSGRLEHLQVARQRRLVEAGALGERAERIVLRRGDLGHQPELGEAQARALHPPVEEAGDAARG